MSGRLLPQLGHRFERPELLEQALTHRSAGAEHNERLEFLGDAVLGFIMADELFRRFPKAREGELTRLRARLVRASTLAGLARALDLGMALRLGGGERKSGGRHRDSILADALEAVVGAVYVDAGVACARELVLRLYAPLLDEIAPERIGKDPKTRLQEWLQARGLPLPRYVVLQTTGTAHEQWFTVSCDVAPLGLSAQGEGGSRRGAEQVAAERLMARLEDSGPEGDDAGD